MSICANDDWTMDLVKDGSTDKETFIFYNLRIDGEDIRGTVKDKNNNNSDLTGTCSPFDSREDVARLTFSFKAVGPRGDVEIFLSGLALQLPDRDKPIFLGVVVGRRPGSRGTSLVEVSFDVGDTGTGNGMQAMSTK